VLERKIKVLWLSADGEPSTSMTPGRRSIHNVDNDTSAIFEDDANAGSPEPKGENDDSDRHSPINTPPSLAGISAPAISDDWKRRAMDAEEKLRAYMERETSGLRQRGGQAAQKTAGVVGATAQQARDAPAGVQVQIVAALCLVSFLLAYFFF
jgi:hypothetical protein